MRLDTPIVRGGFVRYPTRARVPVESQKGPFVRGVVDEQRDVPALAQEAQPQIHEVVGRHLRIEPEHGLG